eukprot:1887958-Rhodomonas_salina.1
MAEKLREIIGDPHLAKQKLTRTSSCKLVGIFSHEVSIVHPSRHMLGSDSRQGSGVACSIRQVDSGDTTPSSSVLSDSADLLPSPSLQSTGRLLRQDSDLRRSVALLPSPQRPASELDTGVTSVPRPSYPSVRRKSIEIDESLAMSSVTTRMERAQDKDKNEMVESMRLDPVDEQIKPKSAKVVKPGVKTKSVPLPSPFQNVVVDPHSSSKTTAAWNKVEGREWKAQVVHASAADKFAGPPLQPRQVSPSPMAARSSPLHSSPRSRQGHFQTLRELQDAIKTTRTNSSGSESGTSSLATSPSARS